VEDPSRRRKGDWQLESRIIREDIEATWPVRTQVRAVRLETGRSGGLWVQQASAVLTPPVEGYPHKLVAMVAVDRTYLTPFDRAEYFAVFQLWVALEVLGLPPSKPAPGGRE